MKLVYKFAAVLLITHASLSVLHGQHAPYGRYTGPNSFGVYRHAHRNSLKSFLSILGAKPLGKDIYCFADKQHGLWLHAETDEHDSKAVWSVFVSSFPNCTHKTVQKANIDPVIWKTPEGIGIGSTREDVLHTYHQPTINKAIGRNDSKYWVIGVLDSETGKIDVGDRSFTYSCLLDEKHACNDDLRVTEFGFRNEKVISISISDSE